MWNVKVMGERKNRFGIGECFKVIWGFFLCMNSQWALFIQSSMYACVMNVEMTLCNMYPSLCSMLRSRGPTKIFLSLLADTVIRHLTTLCSCWCCFVFVLTFAKDLKQISRIQLKPGKLWWSICFYCYFYFGVSSSFQHFQQHISPLRHQSRIILEGWSHCRRSFDINRDWKSTVCLESLRKKWTQLNVYTVFWFTFSLDIL